MADHFLTKTRLTDQRLLEGRSGPVLDSYPALMAALEQGGHADLTGLFAEPLRNPGNDSAAGSISWYSVHGDQPRPLAQVDDVMRREVERRLSRQLAQLQPMLADAGAGLGLSQALYILDVDSIWAAGEHPVLINWGMVPATAALTTDGRAAHFAATLGRYVTMAVAPPTTETEFRDRAPMMRPAVTAAPIATPIAAPIATAVGAPVEPVAMVAPALQMAAMPVAAPVEPPPRWPLWYHWVPLVAAIVLVGLAVLWLSLPGNRIFPTGSAATDAALTDRAYALAIEQNRGLEQRAQQLESAITGAVCRPDGVLVLPDGRTPEGLTPPVEGGTTGDVAPGGVGGAADGSAGLTPVAPDAPLAPSPRDLAVTPQGAGAAPADVSTLVDLIDQTTVLVVNSEGSSTGSGFFVAPDLVMTNFHVVEGATSLVAVTGASLGQVHQAKIVARAGPFDSTGKDYALLKLEGVNNAFLTLRAASQALTLTHVVAAGFPGDVMDTDANFQRLLSGEAGAVPPVFVTEGVIGSEQDSGGGVQLILHSAPISYGNSGGPLLDNCGNVLGINTLVRTGPMRSLNIALAAQGVVDFLAANGVTVVAEDRGCAPAVIAPPSAAITTPEAAPAPPASNN